MFVILGWNHVTVEKMGPALPVTCPRCAHYRYWTLQRLTTWFTLFFAPIIPTDTRSQLCCPICNAAVYLSAKQFQEALAMRTATAAFLRGEMGLDAYQALARVKRPPQLPWGPGGAAVSSG
jgi:hypothetical protein